MTTAATGEWANDESHVVYWLHIHITGLVLPCVAQHGEAANGAVFILCKQVRTATVLCILLLTFRSEFAIHAYVFAAMVSVLPKRRSGIEKSSMWKMIETSS